MPPLQVTPRDYLETALQQLQGSGRAVESKNQASGRAGHATEQEEAAARDMVVRLAGRTLQQNCAAAGSLWRLVRCACGAHVLHPLASCFTAPPQIRESIKSLFPDRDCFTLVRPVNDEDKLARLDTLPSADMRPEFRRARGGGQRWGI